MTAWIRKLLNFEHDVRKHEAQNVAIAMVVAKDFIFIVVWFLSDAENGAECGKVWHR